MQGLAFGRGAVAHIVTVATLCAVLAPAPLAAQEHGVTPVAPAADAVEADVTGHPGRAPDQAASAAPVILDQDALASALNYNPYATAAAPEAGRYFVPGYDAHAGTVTRTKPLHIPGSHNALPADWSRDQHPDGSSTVSVKKPLAAPWDAKVGADVALAGNQPTSFEPGQPLPGTAAKEQPAGGAWANVAVPHLATVEVRVDPSPDQNKYGASLQRTLPLGQDYAVTLQNRFAVTDIYGAPGSAGTLQPGGVPAATPSQVWDSERTVRFDLKSTGTALSAGTQSSTFDGVTHRKLSAEQRLYGPLHVTTSVTDPGQSTASKSISAGFKLNW